jgi:predicted nucleic acid-binding protein
VFLKRIEQGEVKVRTSETVIFETVFTLERSYHQEKAAIRETLLPLLGLPVIVLPRKRRYRKVFSLYVDANLPFADAYHAVLMEQLNLEEIVSFDTDFDRIAGLTRVQPYPLHLPAVSVVWGVWYGWQLTDSLDHTEGTMPEFERVSLQEAKGQGEYISEYVAYIEQVPIGEAGLLRLSEYENPSITSQRLVFAAKALDITLGIKRSGQNLYFWLESPIGVEAKPKHRRGRAPREQPVTEAAEVEEATDLLVNREDEASPWREFTKKNIADSHTTWDA